MSIVSTKYANWFVGTVLTICVILGIELRQIRVERVDREGYWAEILAANQVGRWSWDSEGKLIWDDGMYALFGASRTDFNGTLDGFLAFVYEGDRERIRKMCIESAESGAHYSTSYRLKSGRNIRALGKTVTAGGRKTFAGICTLAQPTTHPESTLEFPTQL